MRRRGRISTFRTPLATTTVVAVAVLIVSGCGDDESSGNGAAGSRSIGGSAGSAISGGSGGTGTSGASGSGGAPSDAGAGGFKSGTGGADAQGGGVNSSGGGTATNGGSNAIGGAANGGQGAQAPGTSGGGAGVGGGGEGANGPNTGGSGGLAAMGGATAAGATAGGVGGGDGSSGSPGQGAGAPSCATSGPGLTTCGKNGDESCCVSPLVEGGTFYRTYQNTGSGATGKADAATVSSFRLDKYEITVGRFRQYVKYLSDGGSPPEAGSGKHSHLNDGKGLADSGKSGSFEPGWDASWNDRIPSGAGATAQWNTQLNCNKYGTWTDEPGDNEMLPLTCLNWWESYAFCIWDGGFLPSEAEWKYAAAGGDELRMYPWGSTNPGQDSEYAIYDCCYPEKQCRSTSGLECAGIVNAAPVGFAALGAGRYGQVDLSGSVFEWLVDRYASYVSPCVDCAYFTGSGNNRVLPGGGFRTTLMPYLLSANRSAVSYAETFRGDFAVGARCARAP